MIHNFKLAAEPFNAIKSGKKTIESRLYDEKRQKIQLGDVVVFTNRVDAGQVIRTKVIGLLRYATFKDLFLHNNPSKFGGQDVGWLKKQVSQFYSLEEQKQNGVLGIEFEIIN